MAHIQASVIQPSNLFYEKSSQAFRTIWRQLKMYAVRFLARFVVWDQNHLKIKICLGSRKINVYRVAEVGINCFWWQEGCNTSHVRRKPAFLGFLLADKSTHCCPSCLDSVTIISSSDSALSLLHIHFTLLYHLLELSLCHCHRNSTIYQVVLVRGFFCHLTSLYLVFKSVSRIMSYLDVSEQISSLALVL